MLKTLIAVLTGLTVASCGYIDYTTCNWAWGMQGQTVQCPSGTVAVGACGSGGSTDCGSYYEGLRCCQLVATKGIDGNIQNFSARSTYAIISNSFLGERIKCNMAVYNQSQCM